MTPTDQQLVKAVLERKNIVVAVLESKGWTNIEWTIPRFSSDTEPSYWGNNLPLPHSAVVKCPPILNSLDACYRLFEKTAPRGYWYKLHEHIMGHVPNSECNPECIVRTCQANPLDRCEAWVEFVKQEKGRG